MTASNASLFARGRQVLPGGVSHELRYKQPHPIYIERAEGAYKWDAEGRRYIDYKMGSAANLLGHNHRDVVEAICRQAHRAVFTSDCHELEIEWAEIVNRLYPSADRTCFTASGTEATMLAIRLGRAFSERDKLLRIDGHFHGWHDYVLKGAQAGSSVPPSLGVPEAVSDLVVVAPADLNAIRQLIMDDPGIGVMLVEVSGANYGAVPLPNGLLAGLRELASERNVVLVFDEVITGFRWSPGGLQARDGIIPDLTTLAKVLTGGLPGGAVCGRADIMSLLDPGQPRAGLAPPVSHKGTFNSSPLVAAAAIAALEHLQTGAPQAHADLLAQRLRDGLREIFDRRAVAGAVYGESSTFHFFLGPCDGTVAGLCAATIRGQSVKVLSALRGELLARGVDMMSYTSGMLSWAHTAADIDVTLQAFDETVVALQARGIIAT